MTMAFRAVKANLINLLGTEAANRYRVIGFQDMAKSAEGVNDTDRVIEVYYLSGNFKDGGGAMFGTTKHDITFRIAMTVSRAASVDLSVLNDPNATDVQRAAALAAFTPAKKLVDDSFDELIDIVYNILMDPRNQEFGGTKYSVGSRWIGNASKDEIVPRGDFAILSGTMQLTCNVTEGLTGETGTQGDIVDVEVEANLPDSAQKDDAKAGVYVDPP